MEIDLMKEQWPTIGLFDNPIQQTILKTDEDNSVFSIWEENYQDLSGWCMDQFHGQCALPIGEFETKKYSSTKNEDNVVSTKKSGLSGNLSTGLLGVKENLEDSSLKVPEFTLIEGETRGQGGISQCAIKSENIETQAIGMNDVLLDPIESSINLRTDDWIQLANVKMKNDSLINTQHESTNNDKNNDSVIIGEYPRSISLELAKEEKDTWDTNTFDNTGSDTFDLLSYLCDDNIQSPDGSIVSRDSGLTTIESNSSIASHVVEKSSLMRESRKARRNEIVRRNYEEAKASSSSSIAAISAALDSVAKMSERSSRRRARSSRKDDDDDDDDDRATKGRAKKRYIDSDSEDLVSECGSYRESREKNNEASRKSRMNKKAKETEMMTRASELERDNRILKMKVEELDKLVTSMRTAILKSALQKSG